MYIGYLPSSLFFLRPHVSPVTVFGSRDKSKSDINTYCKFDQRKGSGRPVKMRCGSSRCDYNIMVYTIPQLQASRVARVTSV